MKKFSVLQAVRARLWGLMGIPKSLRLRICLLFASFLVLAWLVAAFFAWKEARDYVDEFFDAQQVLFAKRLAMLDVHGGNGVSERASRLPDDNEKLFGGFEDDAIGFAVFVKDGTIVATDGEKGSRFIFNPDRRGFINAPLSGGKSPWRVFWLGSADGEFRIAVGQELDYRRDAALDMLGEQIAPWALLLPALLLGLALLLSRELAPLRIVAARLRNRAPDDASLLEVARTPSEIEPMVAALNGFFSRTGATLARERAFVSDAAHELRTPLAGISLQAQLALQTDISEQERREALTALRRGVDRSARLLDQLLALSRLESVAKLSERNAAAPSDGFESAPTDWDGLLDAVWRECRPAAEAKEMEIRRKSAPTQNPPPGNPLLLSMLLRNLLGNAVNYAPKGGYVSVQLGRDALLIENNCRLLPKEQAARLGERFFRPPGQEAPGSGLGLSIARRIAEIHGFGFKAELTTGDGLEMAGAGLFRVEISWRK